MPGTSQNLLKMITAYKPPVLTSIFRILGVLTLILGGLGGLIQCADSPTQGVELMFLSLLGCLFYFGLGQALDYLARTAFSTERLCTILEITIDKRLRTIESNHSTQPIASPTTAPGKERYYYSTDGTQQGPVDTNDLKMMRKDGLVTEETPVLREGESEWRKYQDYASLMGRF